MEETREQIANYQARQLELLSIMRQSDSHAAKCMKLGLSFVTEYPDEYTAYTDARTEYNSNEETIASLTAKLAEMEAEAVINDETKEENV